MRLMSICLLSLLLAGCAEEPEVLVTTPSGVFDMETTVNPESFGTSGAVEGSVSDALPFEVRVNASKLEVLVELGPHTRDASLSVDAEARLYFEETLLATTSGSNVGVALGSPPAPVLSMDFNGTELEEKMGEWRIEFDAVGLASYSLHALVLY